MGHKKWGYTEYVDEETGVVLRAKEVKRNYIYKVIDETTETIGFYKITRKIIKIIGKQQELWNQ